MPAAAIRPITEDEIKTFKKDGIVCLRGLFDSNWVREVQSLVDEDMQAPSGMVKNINAKEPSTENIVIHKHKTCVINPDCSYCTKTIDFGAIYKDTVTHEFAVKRWLRILVIPITYSGFIRSPDHPNAWSAMLSA